MQGTPSFPPVLLPTRAGPGEAEPRDLRFRLGDKPRRQCCRFRIEGRILAAVENVPGALLHLVFELVRAPAAVSKIDAKPARVRSSAHRFLQRRPRRNEIDIPE